MILNTFAIQSLDLDFWISMTLSTCEEYSSATAVTTTGYNTIG